MEIYRATDCPTFNLNVYFFAQNVSKFQNGRFALKKKNPHKRFVYKGLWRWAHQDLNLGPPDYESGALTN
jgi:hypothetical protein